MENVELVLNIIYSRLDNLDTDDLEVIRKRRMEELKKAQSKKNVRLYYIINFVLKTLGNVDEWSW